MKRTTIIAAALLASITVTISAMATTGSIGNKCQTGMFTDEAFDKQIDRISIYERVYLLVHCESLPKGSYTINTQWMDEDGKLQNERPHSFQVVSEQNYSAAFKFKQMPMSMMNTMASGKDFEEHQYGKWSVLTFINSDEINRNYFTITD